jgi:hypothetical protein
MQAVITMPEEADLEGKYVLTERCPLDRLLCLILAVKTSGIVEGVASDSYGKRGAFGRRSTPAAA